MTRTAGGALSRSNAGQVQSQPSRDTSEVRAARGRRGSTSNRALAQGSGRGGWGTCSRALSHSLSVTPPEGVDNKATKETSFSRWDSETRTSQGRCAQLPHPGSSAPHPTQNGLLGCPPCRPCQGHKHGRAGDPVPRPAALPLDSFLPLWATTPGRGRGVSEDTSFRPSPFICSVCSWR